MGISEHFYSMQGEGSTAGVPSYFIRLSHCNLMCGGPNGSLMAKGKAHWWCDSEYVWKNTIPDTFEDVIKLWEDQNLIQGFLDKRIHVIWTGGEPTLPKNIESIREFQKLFNTYMKQPEDKIDKFSKLLYQEIETNGTIVIPDDMEFDQINCSPKLGNSGMHARRRIKPNAIEWINNHPNHWFKFVVSDESDVDEIYNDYVKPFNIDEKSLILMPAMTDQSEFHERTKWVMEMGKKYQLRVMARLHISAWDKTTGV